MARKRLGSVDGDGAGTVVSRRTVLSVSLVAGSGLLVSFHVPGLTRVPQKAAPAFAPNAFIRIERDGRIVLIMHKVEMGQGTYTSMPMILAEELEVDLRQVRLEHAPPDDARYAEPFFGGPETGGAASGRGAWGRAR